MEKVSKKKHHTYEELLKMRIDFKPNSRGIEPFTVVNGILLMFPVEVPKDSTTRGTWACRCFCGTFFVVNYSQIARKVTKSCGCILKMKNRWKVALQSVGLGAKRDIHIDQLPSEYKSRDAKLTCNVCNTSTCKGQFTEHLQQGRSFCKCSFKYKYSFREIKDFCVSHEVNTTWNIISFPDNYTSKKDMFIDVRCKVCNHDNKISYGNFMRSRGCISCANSNTTNRLSKDLSYFIEKSIEKHGHTYDYSKVVYKKCREHVDIICPKHGVFSQSPDNHYNKGKGCPTCKRFKLKSVSFGKSRVEENKEYYLTLPSTVYIMRVGEFIKVGVSIHPDKRAKDIKRDSKRGVELLYYRPTDLYNALLLEKLLHDLLYKYRQDYSLFDGYTECFLIEDDLLPSLMMAIHCYGELK